MYFSFIEFVHEQTEEGERIDFIDVRIRSVETDMTSNVASSYFRSD